MRQREPDYPPRHREAIYGGTLVAPEHIVRLFRTSYAPTQTLCLKAAPIRERLVQEK